MKMSLLSQIARPVRRRHKPTGHLFITNNLTPETLRQVALASEGSRLARSLTTADAREANILEGATENVLNQLRGLRA